MTLESRALGADARKSAETTPNPLDPRRVSAEPPAVRWTHVA